MRLRPTEMWAALPSLPTALTVLLLLSSAAAQNQIDNDFSGYPSGSRKCLTDADDKSGCKATTDVAMNKCLCSNTKDFVTNSAACIKKNDASNLEKVYDTMQSNCENTKTPLVVSKKDFMAGGSASSSSSSSASSTRSSSSTKSGQTLPPPTTRPTGDPTSSGGTKPTSNEPTGTPTGTPPPADDPPAGGMSQGVKNGIIAGGVLAGVAVAGAIAFFVIRRRRNAYGKMDESHPMLPPSEVGGAAGARLSAIGNKDYALAAGGDKKYDGSEFNGAWDPTDPSKDAAGNRGTWGYSPNAPYQPPLPPRTGSQEPAGVFELPAANAAPPAAATGPVEMPATSPVQRPQQYQAYQPYGGR